MDLSQILAIDRPIEYLISGISSTSAIITRFIRSVRVAHPDLAAVTRDLSDLRLTLELLRDEPAVPLVLQTQMLPVLESCGNVLIHIDSILARCSEPAKWIELGRDETARCRSSLVTFRQALALALKAASLNALQNNAAEVDAVKDNLATEVDRLSEIARSTQDGAEETGTVLASYLEAVSGCAQHFDGSRKPQEDKNMETATPRGNEASNREHAGAADQHNRNAHVISESMKHVDPSDEQEAADFWYPIKNITSSYYTDEPAHFSPTNQERRPSPGLPESPTLPGLEGHPSPLPQRSLPGSLLQSTHKHGDHFPTRTEPLVSPLNLNDESPAFSMDRVQYGNDGYFPRDARVTSFASQGSWGSSSGSIPRVSLNMSPVPGHRYGAESPAFQFQGASSPVPISPLPSSPPPEYRRTWINPPTSAAHFVVPLPAKPSPHQPLIKIIPKRHLTDKGKGSEILHIDISPTSSYVATKHSNKFVKIWSIPKNALHGTIKITSYVQPRVRSREYFIRSHAILSENATLIGITTHFGLTLEIYNFVKGGSGAKKVQTIEEAHRWAASQRDAFHNDYPGLAVYRPKHDRIDHYFLARNPGAKTLFRKESNRAIELLKANLPFLPKFPELAYSTDSPILVAAAGPRPGDPPRPNSTILIAWYMKPVSDSKLHSQTPEQSNTSLPDEERHKPYRVCVPDYPALQTALPACLVSHGSTAVSIWIPASTPADASHSTTTTPLSPTSTTTSSSGSTSAAPSAASRTTFSFKSHSRQQSHHQQPLHPTPTDTTPDRLVLVWDLPTNTTRIFSIPPHAQVSISPDCRRLAYCTAASTTTNPSSTSSSSSEGEFVIVDIASAEKVWRWPDAARKTGFASFGQLESLRLGGGSGSGGTPVFEFSQDGRMLVVGDGHGGVGVYEVGEGSQERFELPGGWE